MEGREKIAAKVIELKVNAAFLAAGLTSAGPFDASRADAYAEVIGTNVAGFTDLLARLIAIFRQQPFESSIIAVSSRSEEHTSELQSLMRISYAVFCLKKQI